MVSLFLSLNSAGDVEKIFKTLKQKMEQQGPKTSV